MLTRVDGGASPILCFGGMAPLEGHKLARLTYLDEAGTSQHEPCAVVAGVIVHIDRQMGAVEDELNRLTVKHIPEPDRKRFVFHATDIWSGVRYFKDRDMWPLEKRLAILRDLADVPKRLGVPVCFGIVRKSVVRDILGSELPTKGLEHLHHVLAYSSAIHMVETYFRAVFQDENTIVVAEDRQDARRFLKMAHASLQDGSEIPETILRDYRELPLAHVKDTLHFASKLDSKLLQIADVCSFVIRGHQSGHPKSGELFEILKPALLTDVPVGPQFS